MILQASLQRNCTRSLVELFKGNISLSMVLRIRFGAIDIRRNIQIDCIKKQKSGVFFKKTSDVFQQDSAKIMVRPSWDDFCYGCYAVLPLLWRHGATETSPTGWTYHALFQQDFRLRAGNFYDLDFDTVHITMRTYIYFILYKYIHQKMHVYKM